MEQIEIEQLETIEEEYKAIECDTCRLFTIQKRVNGWMGLNTNDHYGNTVKIIPVYCPTCGKEL